jgi:hypothetical protein
MELSSASGATATTGAKKPRKAAPRKAAAPKTPSRVANATLEAIAGTGTRGLSDDDIPF